MRPFLHFAAGGEESGPDIPVIAVGRLGDPATATEAVANGTADFIALGPHPRGRSAMGRETAARRADPDDASPCNTCINEMRGGARIGCVVNGAAGRGDHVRRRQAPTRPAHCRHRCRPRRPDLRIAGRRGKPGHGVREGQTARRRVSLCRQGARCSRRSRRAKAGFERYVARPHRRLRAQRRHVPLRHQCHGTAGAAGNV